MASVIGDPPRTASMLRQGFRVQRRVIGALIMRDLHTRYGRQNIGYLWLILEPLLLASAIGLLHSRSPNHFSGDIKPVPMALIGYCNFMTFRSMVSRSDGALESSLSLFYHRIIKPIDILVSRSLLEQAGTFTAFAILMGLAVATGIANPPERPLIYLVGVALMFLQSFALSLIVCGLTHERPAIGRLIHPMVYIMMPLSGAFFVMNALPGGLRDFFLKIPLAHIYEIMRYGWFKSARSEYIDGLYLGGWILGTLLIGLLLISTVRQRIHMP
ncbi:ABC transporter permease [Sphingomonas sp. TZW2008]|uniref:ABC transporter permease n=1 Tax=Sphingomonas sp. TZW2008 TaxID=1917973 RepID=UPI000A26D8E3|nr:ABC transporter permease [Sphingomonas sp. TZW2008]